MIPRHEVYVEVFGGSGALLLNKSPSAVEVWNDIDGELVNLFMTVRNHPREFARHVASLPYSRDLYERWQRQLSTGGFKGSKLERATRFYFMLRSCFYGHVEKGWRFALKTAEASRLYNCIGEVEAIARRLRDVHIDHLDFHRCLKNWDGADTFFFVDPPYYDATKYRKGIPFTAADHVDLAEMLRSTKGKWLLTLNNHPTVRELYKGVPVTKVETQLTTWKCALGSKRPR